MGVTGRQEKGATNNTVSAETTPSLTLLKL
jgi:hypothetical protein